MKIQLHAALSFRLSSKSCNDFNPVTPMNDQNRISYNIKQTSDENKENKYDPIPNSLNWHHKNCMTDSRENYFKMRS